MRLHHIATHADWRAARRSGTYTTSTRGRTLAEEGFIHASRGEQVRATYERFYADADEPLVLLVIDSERLDRLGVPWREERVGPGPETFPHLYGALPRDAVVAALPMDARGGTPSLLTLFVREAVPAVVAAVVVMLLAGTIAALAASVWGRAVTLPVALGVLVVGGAAGWVVVRRVLRP